MIIVCWVFGHYEFSANTDAAEGYFVDVGGHVWPLWTCPLCGWGHDGTWVR